MAVQVGDIAPDFTLTSQTGTPVSLSTLLAKGAVVLYFYPKDDTPGCTAEACSFRDSYEVFKEAGAEVVGVSSDSAERHQAFVARHHLPFTLLSDSRGDLQKLYGVKKTLGLFPGRVTYVIDRTGVVRYIFDSQLHATRHVAEALGALKATGNARAVW